MLPLVITLSLLAGVTLAGGPAVGRDASEPAPQADEPQPSKSDQVKPLPLIPIDDDSRYAKRYGIPEGTWSLTSPNFDEGGPYPNDYDDEFILISQTGRKFTLTCGDFDLEPHLSCIYDYLSIDGFRHCGSDPIPSLSAMRMELHFHSDFLIAGRGYRCIIFTPPQCRQCGVLPQQSRIVGGQDAPPGVFPWMARLVTYGGDETICGGSVINDLYILTAAQCTNNKAPYDLEAILGDLNTDVIDEGEERYSIEQIIQHPQFSGYFYSGYDIAVVKVAWNIFFTDSILPICLPPPDETFVGAYGTVIGFGQLASTGPPATKLQFVKEPIWDNADCMYGYVPPAMFCAGGYEEGGRGVCRKDVGGPIIVEPSGRCLVAGVVSFVWSCARPGNPDVYTSVSATLDFIRNATRDATYCE